MSRDLSRGHLSRLACKPTLVNSCPLKPRCHKPGIVSAMTIATLSSDSQYTNLDFASDFDFPNSSDFKRGQDRPSTSRETEVMQQSEMSTFSNCGNLLATSQNRSSENL